MIVSGTVGFMQKTMDEVAYEESAAEFRKYMEHILAGAGEDMYWRAMMDEADEEIEWANCQEADDIGRDMESPWR